MNFRYFDKYTLKQRRIAIIIIAIIVGLLLMKNIVGQTGQTEETLADNYPLVTLITPEEYVGVERLSIIGSVRATSEVSITPERGGRITSVSVALGQSVSAGQIIATIENASERAALLQAEGVYDAAVAASAQNDVSIDQAYIGVRTAKLNAVAAFQSSYNLANSVVRNNIDTFFSNPDLQVPGLRIDGRGYTATVNTERVAYQTLLTEWQMKANTISVESDIEAELQYTREQLQRTTAFVDTFITVFSNQTSRSRNENAELQTFQTTFANLRASLIAQRSNIDAVEAALSSAYESLKRAELTATGGVVSASDAQRKQAQGALQAAQANFAKTIFRSPISGTINSLTVRTGEYVSAFSPIAVVINDSALEIITSVSEEERRLIAVGDEVLISANSTGIVSAIAPAINSETGKFEVRIASNDSQIAAGETVRIVKVVDTPVSSFQDSIKIPLSAVKFAAQNGVVFKVENNTLVALPVTIGNVRGNTIEITSGLTPTDSIVRDVRGLNVGETVTIQK